FFKIVDRLWVMPSLAIEGTDRAGVLLAAPDRFFFTVAAAQGHNILQNRLGSGDHSQHQKHRHNVGVSPLTRTASHLSWRSRCRYPGREQRTHAKSHQPAHTDSVAR